MSYQTLQWFKPGALALWAHRRGTEKPTVLGLIDLSSPLTLLELREFVRKRAMGDSREGVKLYVRWHLEWRNDYHDLELKHDNDLKVALGLMAARG